MRFLLATAAIAVLAVASPTPVAAHDDCAMATIASLHHCVRHAYEMGHIDNAGVANSLLAKLDAAQEALDRGQAAVAVNILNAFINEVEAQAGAHIDAQHAAHMVTHAEHVIAALGG